MSEINDQNLQHGQFYHGTSSFEPAVGDKILPPNRSGAASYWGHLDDWDGYGQSVKGNAYAAAKESDAWTFAHQRSFENPGVRPAVYEVEPRGKVTKGIEPTSEVKSRAGFTVTNRIDTMPGHQGTFPLNWAQHAKIRNTDDVFEANHPTDDYDGPTRNAYPYQLDEASDNYVAKQAGLRKDVERGQDELFDSTPHRVSDIAEKGSAMIRFSRGEINELGEPETRKFPYYPKRGH